jgi:hypothetical protein
LERVKEKCPKVNFLAHYALIGPYDFLNIYEAPNEEVAAKVSLISLQSGIFQAESWVAIPYKRFIELTKEIQSLNSTRINPIEGVNERPADLITISHPLRCATS